ncbi:transmembrane sensor [Pseudomonas chlororaphis]
MSAVDNPSINLRRPVDPRHLVVKQAINWMLRLRNNAGNPRLLQQCDTWRAAHHEHELAWQRVQSLQQELHSNLRAVPGAQVAFETLENSAQRLGRRQALKLLGGVMLVGCATWLGKEQLAWQQWNADFATATGERRGFQLPDGSRLELNTDSAADMDFNAQQRLIRLSRGEIMLTCGPDPQASPSRPLLVRTRQGLFEGFDASFVVRMEGGCTRLSVTAGSVAIHSPHTADGASARVQAGQSYRVSGSQALPVPPLDMDVGAWADGLIVTRNMRLADFIHEVGRYRHGYLGCADEIGDLRLSGVFRLEDTDKLLAILPQTLPVRLRYRTRWWVTLERLA